MARRGSAPVVLGIDLGTTYSVVAAYRLGKVEIFANDHGKRTNPSVVGFVDDEEYVGEDAKGLPGDKQIFDAKRLIGRSWSDENVQKSRKHWPFEVVDHNGAPRIRTNVGHKTETFAPEEISAMVLKDLKKTAEVYLESDVSEAVVTVPAYFNERQRQATKDACKIAGLKCLSMINEPTAAAIAYGLDKDISNKKVFVFDLGGGTFDVSVMEIQGSEFRVIASGGDSNLGGQDFDVRLMEYCLKEVRKVYGLDVVGSKDKQALQEVREACRNAKENLSSRPEAKVPVFLPRQQVGHRVTVTRACFESLCDDLFKKTVTLTQQVLADAKVSRDEVDEVVLVGGSTRIPRVRALLQDLFGGKALRNSINPDEAVAYGAAVHAAALGGQTVGNKLVVLKDVTPLSLGTNVIGGRFSVIIPKNSPVPCKRTEGFCTTEDFQTCCSFAVYQGERPLVKDNFDLNKTVKVAVPPLPEGEAKVDVTFEINVDGLLTVTCVEPTRGTRRQVTISRTESHLSDEDIRDMIEKAKRFQRQDQKEKERIEDMLRRKMKIF